MNLKKFTKLPSVELIERVHHPDEDRHEIIGWVAQYEERGAYACSRNSDDHLMRKYDGYAISVSVLDEVFEPNDVERVLIAEDDRLMYEFSREQYDNGQYIHFEGHDPQRCVPRDEALTVWQPNEIRVSTP